MLIEEVRRALDADRTIDITTTGRRSGVPRRIETWLYRADGRLYLTGSPGRRDWYANLVAHPSFTVHLKQSVTADLPASARPVTDESERRAVLAGLLRDVSYPADFAQWLAGSPIVEVTVAEPSHRAGG